MSEVQKAGSSAPSYRYNTKKACKCGKKTSVMAFSLNRREKVEGWSRDVYQLDTGAVGYGYALGGDGALIIPCRGCGALRIAKKVFGVFKADKGCDGRCMSATGHNCECSCGGANHGAAHAA